MGILRFLLIYIYIYIDVIILCYRELNVKAQHFFGTGLLSPRQLRTISNDKHIILFIPTTITYRFILLV